MFGKLIKALAGCVLGGLTGLLLGKYGGQIGLGGSFSGVAYSDLAAAGILGVGAYFTRNRETIGTILTVATAFQIASVVVKLVWSAIAIPTGTI